MTTAIQILVTGGEGQLGSELKFLATRFDGLQLNFTDLHGLDITNPTDVDNALAAVNYQYLINCAAYTAVDKAESEPDRAYAINATAAQTLATACARYGVKLIQISTDFVFDGKGHRPYTEEDETHPLSVYGASKEQGEHLAIEANPECLIFRTSWLYSSFGSNFVKTMRRLGSERHELNVIFDQVGTPTYARDLAKAMLEGINSGNALNEFGVFHFSNEGVASWYDFAQAIMEMSSLACKVQPINTFEYPTPAARPHYSVLDKRKFKETFGTTIPYWRDSLKACIETLDHEK